MSIEIEREKAERLQQDKTAKIVFSEKDELCGEKIPGLADEMPNLSPNKVRA